MAYVAEAIEIITDDGTGVVSTYSNTALGLAADGHFYLITDRFDLSGVKIVTGDTAIDVWYEGILSRDYAAFTITRSCDFISAGNLESVSSFSFSINNAEGFWDTLKTNGVYLSHRKIKYYRVTSSDANTFNFELRWSGVIDDQPFNELTQSIKCVDDSKDIFKSLPSKQITQTAYPKAPKSNIDKSIPIVLGRVAYSPLVSITGSGELTTLCEVDGLYYTYCTATAYSNTSKSVTLKTPGVTFVVGDVGLIGRYLHVLSGGASQLVKINSCAATDTDLGTTVIYLVSPLDESTKFYAWAATDNTSKPWYFEVCDLEPSFVASNKRVSSIEKNAHGRYSLYKYASDREVFDDISELRTDVSATNVNSTGFPGVRITSKLSNTESSLDVNFPIVPSDIRLITSYGWDTSDIPVGDDCADLHDISNSTYYTLTNLAFSIDNPYLIFDVTVPDAKAFKRFDAVYICFSLAHSADIAMAGTIELTVYTYDMYGRAVTTLISGTEITATSITTSDVDVSLFPSVYFDDTYDDVDFDYYKARVDISAIISDNKKLAVYNKIRFQINFYPVADEPITYTVKLKEIGIIGRSTVSTATETNYATIIGEVFDQEFHLRRSSLAPVETLIDGYEYLMRVYDEPAPIWEASKAYVVGDKIRHWNLIDSVFVCTVAGTSGSYPGPAFDETIGATTTDNTVTWTMLNTIPIDKDSFDAAQSYRADWLIGRTLTEKKDSEKYYEEISKQGFLISSIGATGLMTLNPWLDNQTPTVTFSSTNILKGSLGQMTLTPLSQMYNDFVIKYDYNPGTDKFNRQLTITNIDRPAFPSSTEIAGTGTSLGTFSATYGVINATTYRLYISTTSAHGLKTGAVVSLSGNSDGYGFMAKTISVLTSLTFTVITTTAPTTTPTTTGTLTHLDTSALKWHSYAGGFKNYWAGKAIWEQCHASYKVTRTINKLPDELSACPWYIDPYATDPDGELLWPDLDVGDEHSAVFYARLLSIWTAWQKRQVTLEAPDSATYSALKIGDPVYFVDAKLSAGDTLLGWINEKAQLPRSDTEIERFKFGITFEAEGYVVAPTQTVYDEVGATDIIDEVGATNIIDETGA